MLADDTGQTTDKVAKDTDRDFVMTAEEAVTYGLIDEVITTRDVACPWRPSARRRPRGSGPTDRRPANQPLGLGDGTTGRPRPPGPGDGQGAETGRADAQDARMAARMTNRVH